MKKFLSLFLAIVMVMSLVACGGNNNAANNAGDKNASTESKQLATDQREAVTRALEDYKAAEEKQAKRNAEKAQSAKAEAKEEAVAAEEPDQAAEAQDDGQPKSYVKEFEEGYEPVIDPKVIAESTFFDGDSSDDAK